jgi:XTP/dITP diphosphohydrolase
MAGPGPRRRVSESARDVPDRVADPVPVPRPGDAMRELVAVMDLLRSPGGCPWDADQTHQSLVPYALEEAFEVAEAIEAGDRAGLREELGDLLLQVVFHARVGQEHPGDPFDLDDIASGVTAKLVRRHPHVFERAAGADAESPPPADAGAASPHPAGAGAAQARWERIKKLEKRRASVLDGIPLAQGALARGQKVLSRSRHAGLVVDAAATARRHRAEAPAAQAVSAALGERLLLLVAEADAVEVDAETALRAAIRTLEAAVRAAEIG